MPVLVDEVPSLTVERLKAALKDLGESTVGKKSDLAARLIESLKARASSNTDEDGAAAPSESEDKVSADAETVASSTSPAEVEASVEPERTEAAPSDLAAGSEPAPAPAPVGAPAVGSPTAAATAPPATDSVVKNRALLREKLLREQAMASLRNRSCTTVSAAAVPVQPPPVVHVSVSEEPTVHLRVNHLQRPLAVPQLRAFLEELAGAGATLGAADLWVGAVKSHCYATFATTEQAAACHASIAEGRRFPADSSAALSCFFTTVAAVELNAADGDGAVDSAAARLLQEAQMRPADWERLSRGEEHREPGAGGGRDSQPAITFVTRRRLVDAGGVAGGVARVVVLGERPQREPDQEAGDRASKRARVEPETEPTREPEPSRLDTLFRKTRTGPSIYWLPVSEVVQERRRARLCHRDER